MSSYRISVLYCPFLGCGRLGRDKVCVHSIFSRSHFLDNIGFVVDFLLLHRSLADENKKIGSELLWFQENFLFSLSQSTLAYGLVTDNREFVLSCIKKH